MVVLIIVLKPLKPFKTTLWPSPSSRRPQGRVRFCTAHQGLRLRGCGLGRVAVLIDVGRRGDQVMGGAMVVTQWLLVDGGDLVI